MSKALKILMVASEASPIAKTGGLADSVSALALELSAMGHQVYIIIPRYFFIALDNIKILHRKVSISTIYGKDKVQFYHTNIKDQVEVILPDARNYFGHRYIYGDSYEPLGEHNGNRYGFLCLCAFRWCQIERWYPDIIHCHDWPSAPMGALLYKIRALDHYFAQTVSVLTIHNIAYQGVFSHEQTNILGLSPEEKSAYGFNFHNSVSYLKSGIHCCNWLTTVSPSHAKELENSHLSGALYPSIRKRGEGVSGILNGIDYTDWDSSSDPYLVTQYDINSTERRYGNRLALQRESNLPIQDNKPLIGIIARLVEQKGFEELCASNGRCLIKIAQIAQIVILGNGKQYYVNILTDIANKNPNIAFWNCFSERIAHLIEGGCDFFLMPSRYEPCGLNQMYSLCYGAIPIVSTTGGLIDTIIPYNGSTDLGTGFMFRIVSEKQIIDTVAFAVKIWKEKPNDIKQMRIRGMQQRFSWHNAATIYEKGYYQTRKKYAFTQKLL